MVRPLLAPGTERQPIATAINRSQPPCDSLPRSAPRNAPRPMIQRTLTAALLALLAGSAYATAPVVVDDCASATAAFSGWQVDKSDNICGLDDARQLSSPAVVNYDRLLAATPEMKRLKDEKIDANSSEGIQLRQKAVDRIREKCDALRVQKGYCSVWKAARHSDGRAVADVTDSVIALL